MKKNKGQRRWRGRKEGCEREGRDVVEGDEGGIGEGLGGREW